MHKDCLTFSDLRPWLDLGRPVLCCNTGTAGARHFRLQLGSLLPCRDSIHLRATIDLVDSRHDPAINRVPGRQLVAVTVPPSSPCFATSRRRFPGIYMYVCRSEAVDSMSPCSAHESFVCRRVADSDAQTHDSVVFSKHCAGAGKLYNYMIDIWSLPASTCHPHCRIREKCRHVRHRCLCVCLSAREYISGTTDPVFTKCLRVSYRRGSVKVKVKVNGDSQYSSSQQAWPLQELTCNMGSYSVTCHPAEVTFLWLRCDTLCTSGFMDDIIFARGLYGGMTIDIVAASDVIASSCADCCVVLVATCTRWRRAPGLARWVHRATGCRSPRRSLQCTTIYYHPHPNLSTFVSP